MRAPVPAVIVAMAVAILGAVILGEYELHGARPLLAGLLFGVTVGEVIATVARPDADDPYLPAAAALVTEAGLVWAIWISTGHDLGMAQRTAWFGLTIGVGAAAIWVRSAGRRAARIRDETAPAPAG